MTAEIKQRIDMINRGEVPQGYKRISNDIMPIDWNPDMVGNCTKIKNNLRTPISQAERQNIKGEYPYYGPTQVQSYINTYNVTGENVLIGEDGDHFLKYKEKSMTLMVNGKYNVNNHAHIVGASDKCLSKWFYYYFEHKSLFEHLTRQGAGRYKLTKEALEKLSIILPSTDEQEKIAEILTTCDNVIELEEKLITEKQAQKKWLMQNLLTGKKRLNGFTDEWKKIKLGNCINEINDRTLENNQYEILSVTKNGIVKQSEHFNKQIASEDNTGYKILRKGNLAFSTMNLWMGSVDVLKDFEIGIVSPAYKVFDFNNSFMALNFGKYFMKSNYMVWIYNINSEQGASIVRKNLDMDGLLATKISIPAIQEQTAIGDILSTADREIQLLQSALSEWKNKKKALMQLLLTGKVRVPQQ